MSGAADIALGEDEIDVAPTKALFVDMLTRDIGLDRAVLDLIDNSIDGARKLRPGLDTSLDGLEINIRLDGTVLEIRDNCGGIGIDLAQKYAFRIGRPKEMPATPNSVGQFGVGMKRALFKFARKFEVHSTSSTDRFSLVVDVDEWQANDSWRFRFQTMERNLNNPIDQTETRVTVTQLRPEVASRFALANFQNTVRDAIQSTQQQYIDRGLRIVYRGRTLIATPWQLLRGQGLEPANVEEVIGLEGKAKVFVRVFAGVGESKPRQAGWSVFCNGRMVLDADQTSITGWAELADSSGVVIPKYHNQFSRFRGYAFFDSEDTSLLPWNTTKTGVDLDSTIYQSVRLTMIDAMRPVIDFLNELDREKDNEPENQPLTNILTKAEAVGLRQIARSGPFSRPTPPANPGPPTVSIQFRRPRDQVDRLQVELAARSARDVGEKSFDLAYERYVSDE